MISTLGISTISTISTSAVVGLTAIVGIAAVVSLIFFLAIKEVANAGESHTSLRIARVFNVGIFPLVMTFAAIAGVTIAELL